jgi:hypothetical protein
LYFDKVEMKGGVAKIYATGVWRDVLLHKEFSEAVFKQENLKDATSSFWHCQYAVRHMGQLTLAITSRQ